MSSSVNPDQNNKVIPIRDNAHTVIGIGAAVTLVAFVIFILGVGLAAHPHASFTQQNVGIFLAIPSGVVLFPALFILGCLSDRR